MNLKDYLRNAKKKDLKAYPLDPGHWQPQLGSSEPVEGDLVIPREEGNGRPMIPVMGQFIPEHNDDPMRQRIHGNKNKWQRRWAKLKTGIRDARAWAIDVGQWLWHKRPWRELSPEEKRIKREIKKRKQQRSTWMAEAKVYKKRIRNALTRNGLAYKKRQYERDVFDALLGISLDEVKFDHIVLQPSAIYLRVNTKRLPYGVTILDLVTDEICTDLSIACRHRVTAQWGEKKGVWYVVERATGARGIPTHVRWQEVWEQMPKTAGKFSVPLGLTVNSKFVHRDLTAMVHALIAGTTGFGKSNLMHVILLSLMRRNDPTDARFILVDLKGGMEMHFYEGVPHLLKMEGITDTGIIYDRDRVPDALEWLIDLGQERMEKIKQSGYQKIEDYNHRKKADRLPRIFLFIDEWADIRLVGGLGVDAEKKLSNIAGRMRAVGIHIVLGTQQPKKEVISTLIKSNLPAKFGFACANQVASRLILDHSQAANISEKGRFIYQHAGEDMEIQAPYLSNSQIKQLVSGIIEGADEITLRGHDITATELLEYAIDEHDGKMGQSEMYQHFRGRVGFNSLVDWMRDLDGTEHEIRGNIYKVVPPAGPHARHLEIVEDG